MLTKAQTTYKVKKPRKKKCKGDEMKEEQILEILKKEFKTPCSILYGTRQCEELNKKYGLSLYIRANGDLCLGALNAN